MRTAVLAGLGALALAACATEPNPQLAQLVNATRQPCPEAAYKAGELSGVYATSATSSGASSCRTRIDWQSTRENARRYEQDIRDGKVRSMRPTEARGS